MKKFLLFIYFLNLPFENYNYRVPKVYAPQILNYINIFFILVFVYYNRNHTIWVIAIGILVNVIYEAYFKYIENNLDKEIKTVDSVLKTGKRINKIAIAVLFDGAIFYGVYILSKTLAKQIWQ